MSDELFRLRVSYRKDGRLAYLGHLEVINTIERSVRRSGLPFSVGNGFARRMRIQFSQALPVGASSEGEYYDVMLSERVDVEEALLRLAAATPSALGPRKALYLQRKMPALEAWLNRSLWRVDVVGEGDALTVPALVEALSHVRDAGKIDFMRGDKPRTIELGSTLVGWELSEGARAGVVQMSLDTRSSNLGALRPAVLVEAAFGDEALAGVDLAHLRVCRTDQWHEENGERMEPFDHSFCLSLT